MSFIKCGNPSPEAHSFERLVLLERIGEIDRWELTKTEMVIIYNCQNSHYVDLEAQGCNCYKILRWSKLLITHKGHWNDLTAGPREILL